MLNSIVSRAKACATALFALSTATVSAQAVTVVEYYNKAIDAYFITARANEQTALDAAADFQRTGMTFQAVAAASATASQTKICRFYISLATPYTSSHFYGRQGTDCEVLLAQKLPGFTYEDYDFATQQPTDGVCPAGTVGIYRSFREGENGKTSNHRYSASATTYSDAAVMGYEGEGVVFCATGGTPASGNVATPPPTAYYCPAFPYAQKSTITSRTTLTISGVSTVSTSRAVSDFDSSKKVPFNGRDAYQQFTTFRYGDSPVAVTTTSFHSPLQSGYRTSFGSRYPGTSGPSETYYEPPLVYPVKFVPGQKVDYAYSMIFNPSEPALGNLSVVGTLTFLGLESVTVPAGRFDACKFRVDDTTVGTGSISVTSTTLWNKSYIGIVRAEGTESVTTRSAAAPSVSSYVTEATSISIP